MPTNLDPKEIQTFETAAEDWWKLEGEFKTLHVINPVRLGFIQQRADIEGKKILDVGCGGGILTESLAKAGGLVTGIDMSEGALKSAHQHAKQENISIDYQQITVEDFAETSTAQFDIVTCMELLEHVPDPQSIVKACAQLVKPGGYVFFSTLNRTLKSYLFAIIGAEYILKLIPKGVHTYEKFIRPSELSAWARTAELATTDLSGFSYNPLTHHSALTQNVDINYIVACRKIEMGSGPKHIITHKL